MSAGENGHGSVPLSDSKVKVFAKQTFENISVDNKLTSERMAELHQEKVSLLSLLDRNKLACVNFQIKSEEGQAMYFFQECVEMAWSHWSFAVSLS